MTDKFLGAVIISNTTDWHDVTSDFAAASGAASWVQNQGPGTVLVAYTDSAVAPIGGARLEDGDFFGATGAHIWVRLRRADYPATLAIGLGATVPGNGASGGGGGGAVGGSVAVSNFPATQAISAAALPLPAGAASEAKLEAVRALLASPLAVGGTVSVSNFPATQAVSAAALPLPAGAASEAKLEAIRLAVGSPLQAGGTVAVSNFPATQAISVATLPLPAGAATAVGQVSAQASLTAIAASLPGALGAKAGAASTSVVVASDLANLEPGGAPITGQAMPAGGVGLTGWLSAIYYAGVNSPLPAGAAQIGGVLSYLGYIDSTTALAAGASWPGTTRTPSSSNPFYNYFNASVFADQAGTLYIERTINTGASWELATPGVAVAAGVPASASVRMTGLQTSATSYRVRFVNGATAQTVFRLSSSFSAN